MFVCDGTYIKSQHILSIILSLQKAKGVGQCILTVSVMVNTKLAALAIDHVRASQSGTIFNTVVFIENC